MVKMKKVLLLLITFILASNLLSCRNDIDPPEIRGVTPTHQAVVGGDTTITVNFSESMNKNSTESSFSISSNSGTVNGKITWDTNMRSFSFTPELPLNNGYYYTITIATGAEDNSGNSITKEYISSFFVGTDLTPPTVISTDPVNMAGAVPLDTDISVQFSESMDRMSVERGVRFSPSIEGYFEWTTDSSVIFHPFSPLDFNTVYTMTITTDCADSAGNALLHKSEIFFTVGDEFEKPLITDLGHAVPDGLGGFTLGVDNWVTEGNFYQWEGVNKDSELRFTFSEPVNRESFKNGLKFFPDVETTIVWTGADSCSILFQDSLTPLLKYELRVLENLKDISGNEMGLDFIIFFLVNDSPSSPPGINTAEFLEYGGASRGNLTVNEEVKVGPENSSDPNTGRYKVRFNFTMEMNKTSVHNNIIINQIYGEHSANGDIKDYDWIGNELTLTISSIMGGNNLYKLTVKGGDRGIMSANGVTITNDIVYYFSFTN